VRILIGHHNITHFIFKYDLKIVIPLLMTHFVTPNPTIEAYTNYSCSSQKKERNGPGRLI
jgi:hypothetical protein